MGAVNAGEGYRELDPWELVRKSVGQEVLTVANKWEPMEAFYAPDIAIGGPYQESLDREMTIRVPITVPASYPPPSQEAKDAMASDAQEMQKLAAGVSTESKGTKEAGYTVAKWDSATLLTPGEREYVIKELDTLTHSVGRGNRTKEELFRYLTKLAETWGTCPATKPFTPSKYTRNMPTLDGRTVPVDVYCVLAAFPTGSAAVDHAIKKQLAPGARGVKSRLQDLKEARASLDRAIQLEEALSDA